jgi:hypothetical protein
MTSGKTKQQRSGQQSRAAAKDARLNSRIDVDDLDDARLISARETRVMLGKISEMQLWRMIHNPDLGFPKPIKLADMVPAGKKPRIVSTRNFFRFADVKAWIAKREALSVDRAASGGGARMTSRVIPAAAPPHRCGKSRKNGGAGTVTR